MKKKVKKSVYKKAKKPLKKAKAKKKTKLKPKKSGNKKPAAKKPVKGKKTAPAKMKAKKAAKPPVKKKSSPPEKKSISGNPPKQTAAILRGKTEAAPPPIKEKPYKPPKTVLKKRELEKYRQLLLKRKIALIGDIRSIEESNLSKSQKDASGDLSGYTLHMADVATDNYDREFNLSLADDEREALNKIDEALRRIDSKTYGMCLESGKPINKKRLDVVPWAEFCIEVQTKHEQEQKMYRR